MDMDNENKMQVLVAEIRRIEQTLEKSEESYNRKVERLTNQLISLQEAVKILKNK
jgi:hypothetical protein